MNRTGSAIVTLPGDTRIVITRQFDAPAALLFQAYTTPELVRQWWGYADDVWEVCEIDLRVGGAWRWVTTHTNESGSFPVAFHGVYEEISPPDRLVYTEVFEGVPGGGPDNHDNATRNTIVFEEADGVTTMTMTTDCPEAWVRDVIIESGMEHGMQVSMDRLEAAALALAG